MIRIFRGWHFGNDFPCLQLGKDFPWFKFDKDLLVVKQIRRTPRAYTTPMLCSTRFSRIWKHLPHFSARVACRCHGWGEGRGYSQSDCNVLVKTKHHFVITFWAPKVQLGIIMHSSKSNEFGVAKQRKIYQISIHDAKVSHAIKLIQTYDNNLVYINSCYMDMQNLEHWDVLYYNKI